MKIWIYLLICIASSVYATYEIGTVTGVVAIIATASLWSVAGFYVGHKVGHLQTTDLMKKRIQEVVPKVNPKPNPPLSKRLRNGFRNKRLVGK